VAQNFVALRVNVPLLVVHLSEHPSTSTFDNEPCIISNYTKFAINY
jgi:hypothetical protein